MLREEKVRKLKEFIEDYRLYIFGFVIMVALFICFKFGAMYACDDGVLYKTKCVKPQTTELVQICNYKVVDYGAEAYCNKACREYVIHDREAFNNALG